MKKKNDKVVIAIIILTIMVLAYLIFFNIKKNNKLEISAVVKETGNNYLIVITDDNTEYLLNTDEEYNTGDKINVVLKNIKETSPVQGDVVKIDTISRTVEFSITDIPEGTEDDSYNNNNNNNNSINNTDINDNSINNTPQNEVATEDDIIAYFSAFEEETNDATTFKNSVKEKFVALVDFLFYDGQIKGKTFKELSNSAKLKVLEIFLKIDNKLESKFPNYKEKINSTGNKIYTNVKNKAIETYFDITTEICTNDEELCDTAKKGLSNLKESFSLTWDFIKEMAGVGITKLKNWYEIWREV